MVPILHPLPLDLTGAAPSNLMINMERTVKDQAGDEFKIIVLEKGYFYTHDLVIYDHLRRKLNKGTDYQVTCVQPTVQQKTGFGVCAIIAIRNPMVNDKIFITARMVGGEYCRVTDAIVRTARNLLSAGGRKVAWKDLADKPDGFRPNGHQHGWWQLYGFTKPTSTLQRMTNSQGDLARLDFKGLYDEWSIIYNQFKDGVVSLDERLTTHINDHYDPHQVTKLQVRLENVYNGYPATSIESRQPSTTVMDAYTTPYHTKESIEYNFLPSLEQHIEDFNNPHTVSAATLGTYDAVGLQRLASDYYDRGSTVYASDRFEGRTWNDAYTQYRQAIPIVAIRYGRLNPITYSNTATPPADHILTASTTGVCQWQPIRDLFTKFTKKGNMVYYITGTRDYNTAAALAIFNNTYPNKAPGSIGIFRWSYTLETYSGNGSIWTPFPVIGVFTVGPTGVWQF